MGHFKFYYVKWVLNPVSESLAIMPVIVIYITLDMDSDDTQLLSYQSENNNFKLTQNITVTGMTY
jgi:hypothetical protein